MDPQRRTEVVDRVEAALSATDDEDVAQELREALSYLRAGER